MHINNLTGIYSFSNEWPLKQDEDAICFAFYENKIMIKENGTQVEVPTLKEIKSIGFNKLHFLGNLADKQCYGVELMSDKVALYELKPVRVSILQFPKHILSMAGRAYQIVNWGIMNRYCGKCGTKTISGNDERVIKCPSCGSLFYPRISPAIIVAILKEDEILLAHNNGFKSGLYSLIAGFVEPGETFEECAKREVMEEVGIRIKDIKYYGSQPWPFPDSLMIGLTARYDTGDIRVDGVEIGDAAWYKRDNMPEIPQTNSIAGRIIRAYLKGDII